ncbi:MAG: hypothetical protein O2830_01370 [Verrucomicrobia bacterium]|jgi:hypothetical protein|uniref:Uncharacterized protein n=1 Tax=Verrucomicrobia subdivision 6 bacterium BACL9 MAG-120924-bin69 TaxID=1655635 RepID=A0A0R2XA87_9BACT|nr:MAG: hypothetical protein ABS33_05420 [Verrucomicrobia subdivision 6 bacterium BACL9 MAG-120924-bin69]MDA0324281.1 hypothetical protein [Verrucomicrobiota bacterium]MDA0858064.1 hypothetical protein [Verrucomicrobiota bacterium]MDA1339854.1 hypothetical protein [Verrucomicrobiota bacterium]
MIHRFLLTLLLAISSLHAKREVQPLTQDWKFIRQDVDLYADTKKWETVTTPHTWNAMDGQAGPGEISLTTLKVLPFDPSPEAPFIPRSINPTCTKETGPP